jgi:hypothetical protein
MHRLYFLEELMTQDIGMRYAVTQGPTPVFNTPNLIDCFGGDDGDTLPLDAQNLMRNIETVLFPRSKVELLERVAKSSIWRIRTDEYPFDGEHYIDDRFIQFSHENPPKRTFELPPMPEVVEELKRLEGTRYIWGGNWPEGLDLLLRLYPSRTPLVELDPLIQDTWKLKGVDCSGLIHYATKGWTPRNSSALVNFGNPVSIEGLDNDNILSKLRDLDLIVWEGHVVCILNHRTSIESQPAKGVVKLNLSERLAQIMQDRKPVDDWRKSEGLRFVVRRWHPDQF